MPLSLLIALEDAGVVEEIACGVRLCWPDAQVVAAGEGLGTIRCFELDRPDLVILQPFTTSPDGGEVCRHIRARSSIPILMLARQRTTIDVVRTLDAGADDYIAWPLDMLELLARLRALLRRSGMAVTAREALSFPGFWLDAATREVCVEGQRIRLTSTEYRLLEKLVCHAGATVSHRQLLERVWGAACVNDVHYLKVFIQRLRRKLGTTASALIRTEWGVGYTFVPPTFETSAQDNLVSTQPVQRVARVPFTIVDQI